MKGRKYQIWVRFSEFCEVEMHNFAFAKELYPMIDELFSKLRELSVIGKIDEITIRPEKKV